MFGPWSNVRLNKIRTVDSGFTKIQQFRIKIYQTNCAIKHPYPSAVVPCNGYPLEVWSEVLKQGVLIHEGWCGGSGGVLGADGRSTIGRHHGARLSPPSCRPQGLVTILMPFCFLFTIKDRCKKVLFQRTHIQGFFCLLFLMASWDLRSPRLVHHRWQCPCRLKFQKQRTRRVEGPLKAPRQLKKPPQKRVWDGDEEDFKRQRVIDLPSK